MCIGFFASSFLGLFFNHHGALYLKIKRIKLVYLLYRYLTERKLMDTSAVAQILENLTSCPAGNLESQTLEFKGWCRDEKELSREVSDTAVCLANAEGGLIIVGVDDKRIGL